MVKVTQRGEDRLSEVLATVRVVSGCIQGRDPALVLIALGAVTAAVEEFAAAAGEKDAAELLRMGRELHADMMKNQQQQANPRGGGTKAKVQNERTGEFTCDLCGRTINGSVKKLPGNKDACRNCVRKPPGRATDTERQPYQVGQPVLWTYDDHTPGGTKKTVRCVVAKVTREGVKVRLPSGEEKRARLENVRPDPAAVPVQKGKQP